jgi:hypothetical protein
MSLIIIAIAMAPVTHLQIPINPVIAAMSSAHLQGCRSQLLRGAEVVLGCQIQPHRV